ncbi:MAG: hypothetical protein KGI71_04160 [Patescibacteria group bacterium]|nr:hypothetical protein [Patescibacteria group bacterium]
MTGDLDEWLDHWARWCLRTKECYPEGWENICGSIEAAEWVPYRNGDQSVQEKLEKLVRGLEPDARKAGLIEVWINQLADPLPTCLRVEYLWLPDWQRQLEGKEMAEWQIRRALSVRTRTPGMPIFSDDAYGAAIGEAHYQLRDMMLLWARGV